jgi:hypothetical protein
MDNIQKLKKQLDKIETELSKCRGSVLEDGWQTMRYAKKMRKWDYYAQEKMKILQQIEDYENNICINEKV